MNIAGYIVKTPGGDTGTRGDAYTYILAKNGLFLETENSYLRVRIPLSQAQIRGLCPVDYLVELRHGKISSHLCQLVVDMMAATPEREMFASIIWDGERYSIRIPDQEREPGQVKYNTIPGTVVDIHSHGSMGAFFSLTDNQDNQGFVISLVLGHVDALIPQVKARLCVYGYFHPLYLDDIFDEIPPLMEELE